MSDSDTDVSSNSLYISEADLGPPKPLRTWLEDFRKESRERKERNLQMAASMKDTQRSLLRNWIATRFMPELRILLSKRKHSLICEMEATELTFEIPNEFAFTITTSLSDPMCDVISKCWVETQQLLSAEIEKETEVTPTFSVILITKNNSPTTESLSPHEVSIPIKLVIS